MRPSKSRSRPKNNRRPTGNIVNRVFDSSGPEGKVRGTPQQIIDKYLALARDATVGNDRVAAENFHQHAEHYTRMLGEAMREAEARREQHEAQFRRDRGPNEGPDGGDEDRQEHNVDAGQRDERRGGGEDERNRGPQPESGGRDASPNRGEGSSDAGIIESGSDSGLVETPESQPKPRRGGGRRRSSGPRGSGGTEQQAGDDSDAGTGVGDPPPASAAE